MKRITIFPGKIPVKYRYIDSVHAALVAGLTSAGVSGERLVGGGAADWTFACKGFAARGGLMTLKSLLVSTADPEVARAFEVLDPEALQKRSSNGDVIDFSGGRIVEEMRRPASGQDEICLAFASPFALIGPKTAEARKTWFVRSAAETDFPEAIRVGLQRRAGRDLDVEVAIDRLTLLTEGRSRPVALRQAGPRRVMIPGFSMPVTLRGNAEDLSWVYFSGIGAKTRLGFGCPILPT
ncbi:MULTISPECIES: CRISPR-associated endoribonuclease Cas6 [Rhodobacterales]|uniref:CRISPR-associated endoribonuclease Cas6 n=1 Tax=Rhodobacterales TaxID=204455 RepID=UPI001108EBB0|nr:MULTISPECIES: CRISPR-associated endoribonuclease Cas6 [Rhodobacterales]